MKNFIFVLSFLIISLIALPVLGQDFVIENPFTKIKTVTDLIEAIIQFLKSLALAISVILVIYSGYLYITSAGNQKNIETAQKVLIWALVGIGVVLIASAITKIIEDILEVDLTTESNIIERVGQVNKKPISMTYDHISIEHYLY